MATGAITDRPLLAVRMKLVIVLLSLLSGSAFFLLALSFEPYAWEPFVRWGTPALLSLCAVAGFFRGGVDPLYFEMAAVSEGLPGIRLHPGCRRYCHPRAAPQPSLCSPLRFCRPGGPGLFMVWLFARMPSTPALRALLAPS